MTPGARSLYIRPPLGTLADDPTALPAILSGAASHGAQVGTLLPLRPSGARDDPQGGPPSRRTIPVDGEDSPSATEEGASDKSKGGGWWGGERQRCHVLRYLGCCPSPQSWAGLERGRVEKARPSPCGHITHRM